jgi:hypothetical protein
MKQETLEEAAENYSKNWEAITGLDYEEQYPDFVNKLDFINGAKWQQEQDNNKYSEEDMVKFVSFVGKNYIKAKGFYYMKGDFEKKHKVSIHQILEQFKNK